MPSQNPKTSLYLYTLPAIIISIFLALSLVSAWTEPSMAPPGGNVFTPLNVGNQGQFKEGGIILNTGGAVIGLIVDKGNVGIGATIPGAKLEVAGQIKITGGSPGANKVLTSDAAGLASWQTAAGVFPSGTSGQTLRYDGTSWAANSVIFNNGTNVGIGTASPQYSLDVNGTARATNINLGGVTRSAWPFSGCVTRTSSIVLPAGQYGSCASVCSSGEIVTGGGFMWPHEPNLYKTALRDFHWLTNGPHSGTPRQEKWIVFAYNGSTVNFTVYCYANCCK